MTYIHLSDAIYSYNHNICNAYAVDIKLLYAKVGMSPVDEVDIITAAESTSARAENKMTPLACFSYYSIALSRVHSYMCFNPPPWIIIVPQRHAIRYLRNWVTRLLVPTSPLTFRPCYRTLILTMNMHISVSMPLYASLTRTKQAKFTVESRFHWYVKHAKSHYWHVRLLAECTCADLKNRVGSTFAVIEPLR